MSIRQDRIRQAEKRAKERDELVKKAKELHDQGFTFEQIANKLDTKLANVVYLLMLED